MTENTGVFLENIHLADYLAPYSEKLIKSDSMIADRYRTKESLNGMWRYCVDQYDTCLRAKWFEENYYDEDGRPFPLDFCFDTWETIKVPACWNLQDEKLFLYEGSIVYSRRFIYRNHGEDKVFIKFGGAAYEAYVFVNKKYMGKHEGASTAFYIDVTDVLEDENRIVVVVNNTRKRTGVPCDNTDWFNYGGLYRDVEILRLPKDYIQYFSLGLASEGKGLCATVQVGGDGAGLAGSPGSAGSKAVLRIDELNIKADIDIKNGKGELTIEANPVLWTPENPKLYDVTVEYGNDSLRERIGFRDIKVVGTDVFLNGEKILLKGVCAHEDSVLNGKAVSEAEIREYYKLAKEMNCNYIRLAHYPHSEACAQIADEVGMLLWEEVPVYWAIEFGNKAVYENAENQLTELIKRGINRASIIIWSVGNENPDTDPRMAFMKSLALLSKKLDPTRLVSAACLVNGEKLILEDRLVEFIDIVGINEYYGWYEPDFSKLIKLFNNSNPSKPVIISEFGADARVGYRGTKDEIMTEDNQLYVYQRQIETFKQIPYIKGTSPWIFFDFRCPRRAHPVQNYYNIKGLLSADKTYKKPSYFVMQEFYANWKVE